MDGVDRAVRRCGAPVIPFSDDNQARKVPWVTLVLSALCIIVYFAVQPTGTPRLEWTGFADPIEEEDLRFVVDNAAIPCELVKGRPLTEVEYQATFRFGVGDACSDDGGPAHSPGKVVWLALIMSMFLHGSIPHLFGNLLFLWVFGNNVEARKGWWRYLLLYLVGGAVATAAHVAVGPNSTVPIVGASGAIAAVMGAYFVLWPSARIKTVIWLGPIFLRKVQALWLLVIWVAQNLLLVGGNSGVAWAAHVGGFAFGALVGLWWRHQDRRQPTAPSLPTAAVPA
jgi:membrane associated rhomboid family serine protease